MNTYISLLRGINVSGQKKILMKDLKNLYQQLGFSNVITYIQSGNVVFKSDSNNTKNITAKIVTAIKQHYGFDVPVTLLSHQQMISVINNCPINNTALKTEPNKVMVFYLNATPTIAAQNHLLSFVQLPDTLTINKKVVYLYCPNGFGKSKLSNNFIESKLKLSATARNWNTTNKLVALSSYEQ